MTAPSNSSFPSEQTTRNRAGFASVMEARNPVALCLALLYVAGMVLVHLLMDDLAEEGSD